MNRHCHIGIVGSGFIARGLTMALDRQQGLAASSVLTRRSIGGPNDCAEFPRRDLLTNSIDALLERSDVIVDCSGDVLHATEVIDAALRAGKPVVTMNAEFHITAGSHFVGRGVLTEAQGDQPGSLAALAEEAREMGFRVLAYGNRKGYYHPNPPPEQMRYWADKQGLSLEQVTAATDGTKVQIEQALVANGLGATLARDGMLGPASQTLEEGGQLLAREAVRIGQPIADYVLAPTAPAGVFVAVEHDPRQKAYLEYLKLGPGPWYVLVRNYHLCHLEIAATIRRVVGGGQPLLDNSPMPRFGVAALAKRELRPGEIIRRGIGSFEVRGEAVSIASHPEHVPIGLLSKAIVRRKVLPDTMLMMDDVELPDSLARRAWATIRSGAPGREDAPVRAPAAVA